MATTELDTKTSHHIDATSSINEVEFGRNTMCRFLSTFFIQGRARVNDFQQEKFFDSINKIIFNKEHVLVTDADRQHTFDSIRTTSSYYFEIYIVSLFIWSLSSKKFTPIHEHTIDVLANLYGQLAIRWPELFRIFVIELIDTLNDLIKYDVEFIEEEIDQPKRLQRFVVPKEADGSFSTTVNIERCIIEFNSSDDINRLNMNLIALFKHLACSLSTLLDRPTTSILIGTACEMIRTADVQVKSAMISFLSIFLEHESLPGFVDDLTPFVHFSMLDMLLNMVNFIHTESQHSIQLERDFAHFLHVLCRNSEQATGFFIEYIGFVLPRLKDLLVHAGVTSKTDIEFPTTHRSLRLFGEIQTETYLEQLCNWLSVLFECGATDLGTSSLLAMHALEIVEHLLANLDECLLAKYFNRALGRAIIWSIEEKIRTSQQQTFRTTNSIDEKYLATFEIDIGKRVFNIYCLITAVCQAFVGCRIRQIKFESIEENDFYISWLTIDEISSIYGYLINTLVHLANAPTADLFSKAYEYVLATIVATSIYISDQLDVRLRDDTLSILGLSWLASLSDWYDFTPTMDTCKITKQLAQGFQPKFNHHDRLISLRCLSLFGSHFYPSFRLHIFTSSLHNQNELDAQLTALEVLPMIQHNLRLTTDLLSQFYSTSIDDRLKSATVECWRLQRCLFDGEMTMKIHPYFDRTVLNSFELVCSRCEHGSSNKTPTATSFSLSHILPVFHLFSSSTILMNYHPIIHFFQSFDAHQPFIRPITDTDEYFLEFKRFVNIYIHKNSQEHFCLLTIIPYLFKTSSTNKSPNRQWENTTNDILDQFLFDTLTQLNNDALRPIGDRVGEHDRLLHMCSTIARRTCNEDIFVFALFLLIDGLGASCEHTARFELMHIAQDEYFRCETNKNIHEQLDLTIVVQQHSDSLFRIIAESTLVNAEQPSDICLRHLHLLFGVMQQQQNGSSFSAYLKRILPDLMPWIVEERSSNASRVIQHLRTAMKIPRKKLIFDYFSAIYAHVWRHVRLGHGTVSGEYSISRVGEVNDFIEQESDTKLESVFRFAGPPVFSKLLLHISTQPEHVMKGLQMAVGILENVPLPTDSIDRDYSKVVTTDNVFKALQSKLLGILCDFEAELLSNSTPLPCKRRVLLSLIEVLKFMESPRIVATRVKLLRSLRLALQCSSELSQLVFDVWQEFIRHLSTNIDVLCSMMLQAIAALLPLSENSPEQFQELVLLMLNNISISQVATMTDDLLLIPQLNNFEKIKSKLNKCKNQQVESEGLPAKIQGDERSLMEQQFERLIVLLNFDMADIRLHSLNSLHELLKTNRTCLLQMCLARDTVPAVVSRLIWILLERTNDSHAGVRTVAIDCLGEIGAIDPGRIEFSKKIYSQTSTSTSLINRLLSNSSRESQSTSTDEEIKRSYFNLHSTEFALEFFAELTRAFLAADQVRQQDTISYAIQECLKFYNLNLSDDEKAKPIPRLWSKLSQEQQELFKPLRTSKYVLSDETTTTKNVDAVLKQSTIRTYEQWLMQWVPSLIQYLPPGRYSFFQACLYASRFNSSIGSFLLPYVILHLIGENLGQEALDREFKALLTYTTSPSSTSTSLSFDENNTNEPSSELIHQVAQTIFTLIDFLLLFCSLNAPDPNETAKQLAQMNVSKKRQVPPTVLQEPFNPTDGTWNILGITRVRDYVRSLHTDLNLAQASFKYDNYTRAYRHFEMYSLDYHQNNAVQLIQHSEFLLKLYHRLNDTDSAYGLIAIRDMTPRSENKSTEFYEEILSYELIGQIDEAIVAYEISLQRNQPNQTTIHLYLGYLNNLIAQQQFQHTIDQSTGIIVQHSTWTDMLNPLRIEAAWKLGKWDLLEKFCSTSNNLVRQPTTVVEPIAKDNEQQSQTVSTSKMNILNDLHVSKQFEAHVGRILCQAIKRDRSQFNLELRTALNSLLGPISAASMEVGAYERAYDSLAKLHLLKDLERYVMENLWQQQQQQEEDVVMIVDNDQSSNAIIVDHIWSQRHALLPPNSKYLEPSLALRRTLLLFYQTINATAEQPQHALEIGECWLRSARIARASNNSLAAIASLMKANQSHPIEVAIERAQWMWDKGEKDRAVMSLKQKKIELLDPRPTTTTIGQSGNHRQPVSADHRAQLWLLLARYSEQNSPHEAVFEMYKQAQEAAPHWEETHFYLAQFYDTLLSSTLESDPTLSSSTAATTTNSFVSSTGLSLEAKLRIMEYIRLAVTGYCRSLRYGCEFIYQSLTRLLTIWLDFASDLVPLIKSPPTATSRKQQVLPSSAAANLPDAAQIKQHGQAKLAEITREVSTWTTRIPPYLFLAAFPYMVSRICHGEDMTSKALSAIITQVFAAFPQQTLWMMINLYGSSNTMRRDRCIAIWNEASNIEPGLHDFVVEATILIKQLDTLCMHAVAYGQNKISLSAQFKSFKRSYANQSACPILIPIQAQMQVSLPPPPIRFSMGSMHAQQPVQQAHTTNIDLPAEAAAKLTAMANKQGPLGRPTSRKGGPTTAGGKVQQQKSFYDPRHQPFSDTVVTIHSFEDIIEVLTSLQRPKKIVIRGSDGLLYPFLCKSQDDLRVDSRCLDFCHLFNKCLKKNSESRRRQLNICTYAVYPINERCGLIEWLPNLCTFRSLVTKFYRQRSSNFAEVSNREIKVYGNTKDKSKEVRYNDFLKLLAYHQPSVFHQYFFAAYPDPNRWYISRMNFVRSTAVMSMIGYIMGLGDRHCENILIDTCSGETVHVDFNCLFNKGLTFEIPEKVPFRLTHNIVDGMGVLGVEGVFRKTCEIILHLIRDERELLVSVLKTFIYDPLVEWKSSTKEEVANMRKQQMQLEGGEVVNMKAQTHVRNILERVRGFCTDELTGKRVVLPLSVEGQVDHLIRQATSNELLCQMFVGWAAYL